MVEIIITNMDEFKEEVQAFLKKKMFIFGQLLVNEIQDKIQEIPLIDTTDFWKSIRSFVESDGTLVIESGVKYGVYLEYGTLGYWRAYGLDKFNEPLHPKKRDMTAELKKAFPTGMQSFSPIRRVLFNEPLMSKKLQEAFDS